MDQKNAANNKLHIPLNEKLKSIPEIFGIRLNEEPDYQVLKKDGDFEIRQYDHQVLAHYTSPAADYESFKGTAFRKLANFIFGGNAEHKNVSMTSPVLQEQQGAWTMTFILPKEFTLQMVPKPLDAEIKLEEVSPYRAAVVSYSGNNTEEKMKVQQAKLKGWIYDEGIKTIGNFYSAQYDAPFVIPALKHNEIQIKIENWH